MMSDRIEAEILDVLGEEVAAAVDTPLVVIKGSKGDPGKDGITPTIGQNGNWYLGEEDTGKPSRGAIGAPGKNGTDGHSPVVTATKSGKTTTISVDGAAIATVEDGADGAPGKDGADGSNGKDGKDGAPGAKGADGITPTIGANGHWYLGPTDTGKPSRGEKGEKGDPGKDGAGMDITGATVGQIAKITAVDASGVPTAWGPVDMPSGGSSDAVLYTAQELTFNQKFQARKNIEAAGRVMPTITGSVSLCPANVTDSNTAVHTTTTTAGGDDFTLTLDGGPENALVRVKGIRTPTDADTNAAATVEYVKAKVASGGITPTIGANGNWFLGEEDTGKPSRGAIGSPGKDGVTPHIGDNGNWFLGTTDTGKPSRGATGAKGDPGIAGQDGHSPVVTATKSGKTTTISVDGADIATVEDGVDGKPGSAGSDGITPHIGDNGNWYLGDTDTGKPSRGETGASGAPGADYTLTEADKAEIADMVDGATIVQAPKYVNSTTEMTDVNRPYVLISTGHIWANANVEIETTMTDTITATDENPYHDGYRLGSDATSDSMTPYATGYFLTPLIDLTKAPYQGKTIQIHLEGAHFASGAAWEQWIQTRVYGNDKSVLVNRYFTMADASNDNNIAHHCNGTMSIAYNSETSATVTLSVPPTYGPSATPIGYIRFCAKGAVANSNITITYTGISTGVQWYDTGVTYGGGQDAQLAAKVSALNNEGSAPAAYNLLTPAVIAYYNKPAYPDGDYSATNFVRATLPYRADIPQPVTLKWQHNEDAVQTTISVNTSATVLSAGVKQYDATGYDNYPIYNLLPNKTYYYTVTHLLADGSLVTAKTGSFTTSNVPWRLLKVDGIQNVRDLGGWSGLNGKKVKYGKLFRGSALDDSEFPYLLLSGHGRTELVSDIGIRADLDLRYNYTESAISKDMAFLCKGYGSYAQAITTPDYRTAFKTILEWIVARLSESHPKPVYFHCQGGCDRTGTLSFLLLGLLGVSESDLAREYELSSFSEIGAGRVRNSTVYGYSAMVTALKAYAGNTLTEKFVDFAETGCGISAETISSFRGLMLA